MEINYAAAAYDELNMCKSRLKAVYPEQIKDNPDAKSLMYISVYEIDEQKDEFTDQLATAKMKFLRLQGTQKYLKHLQKNTEPEVCPICKQLPENKVRARCQVCVDMRASRNNTFRI